jgi:hypothetical protein
VIAVTTTGLVLAQTAPPSTGGWRRATDAPPAPTATGQDPEPVARSDAYGQPVPTQSNGAPPAAYGQSPPPDYGQAPPPQQRMARPAYSLPPVLTVKPGTYMTVRINQGLSTDRNQQGDPFSATLDQPLVVDGVVVAERGQMVYGTVAGVEKQKSDHPSRMALQLTSLTLADGTQEPVHSRLVARQGGRTPAGAQAGTVATTTAVGAGIGAVADWGTGALIGGGIGAAAGLIGVILTRNHATVVYPETALTFEITTPVEVSTARAPQSFRYVGPGDYNGPQSVQLQRRPVAAPCYGCAPAPYAAPYPVYGPYPYAYGYPYFGPGFGLVIGRGYGGYGYGYGRYGWGRGYRRWR